MKKLTIAQVYQFVVLAIIVVFGLIDFYINKQINEMILGAMLLLTVGITGESIGIKKD
jgi:hypothetical protein